MIIANSSPMRSCEIILNFPDHRMFLLFSSTVTEETSGSQGKQLSLIFTTYNLTDSLAVTLIRMTDLYMQSFTDLRDDLSHNK